MDTENPPQYPVIHPNPHFSTIFKNFGWWEFRGIIGLTSISFVYGYIFGKTARMPAAVTSALVGLSCGLVFGVAHSMKTLQGISENSKEIKKYGFNLNSYLRYPIRKDRVPIEIIDLVKDTSPSK